MILRQSFLSHSPLSFGTSRRESTTDHFGEVEEIYSLTRGRFESLSAALIFTRSLGHHSETFIHESQCNLIRKPNMRLHFLTWYNPEGIPWACSNLRARQSRLLRCWTILLIYSFHFVLHRSTPASARWVCIQWTILPKQAWVGASELLPSHSPHDDHLCEQFSSFSVSIQLIKLVFQLQRCFGCLCVERKTRSSVSPSKYFLIWIILLVAFVRDTRIIWRCSSYFISCKNKVEKRFKFKVLKFLSGRRN